MFSGILPVRLLFFTSLQNRRKTSVNIFTALVIKDSDCATYKYHSPVNWHMSGDSEPIKLFPLKPLSY